MARPIRKDIPELDRHRNGNYYIRWYDAVERRMRSRSLKTSDPVEAKEAFGQYLLGGHYTQDDSAAGPTVKQVLERYLKEHADVRCAASERQRHAAAALIGFFGGKRVSNIDIFESREYVKHRKNGERPVSLATIRRELNTLIAAVNHDVKFSRRNAYRVQPHQVPHIELPIAEKKAVEVLTVEQVKALVDAAEGRMKSFLVLLYFTAARREAIRDLTVGQVDFDRGEIRLHRGGAETIKRKAVVPILEPMIPHLKFLVMAAVDGRLFPEPFDAYRRFKTICRKVGIEAHPHVFRHSRATHLLQSGRDPYLVAKLLGDSLQTVERTYGHSSTEYERNAVADTDGVFG